jgi:hypothetical protein
MNPNNRKAAARMARRTPVALAALYLISSAYWISDWYGWWYVWYGKGALTTAIPVIVILVGFLAWFFTGTVWVARVMHYPVRYYMGRNNNLWFWMFMFSIFASILWANTGPENVPLTEKPAVEVTTKEIETAANEEAETAAKKTNSKKISPEAKAVAEETKITLREIDEKWANYDESRRFKTDVRLEYEKQASSDVRWHKADIRWRYMKYLWLLTFVYLFFAASDEAGALWGMIKRIFARVSNRMSLDSTTVSKPILHETVRKILGVSLPAAAVAATTGTLMPRSGFWREFMFEVLGETAGNLLPFGRRR